MRVPCSLLRVAAALLAVLLPFAVPQEQGLAQGLDAASPRIISNIAEASWQADGARRSIASNPVRFEVRAAPVASPPAIRVYRRGGESGTSWSIASPAAARSPGRSGAPA